MGKTVRVTGKIIMYRDRPEIVVNTPSQIDIIQEGERNPNVIKPGEES
jgi:DNA/RNA endonuclease YhcR with UshA esterase domain